jgi:tetratricopeptide (TPR) repeat protein
MPWHDHQGFNKREMTGISSLQKARKFAPLLLIVAGLVAYHNIFTGAFIYDDKPSILDNPTIRHLWPIGRALSPPHKEGITVEGRPLINLSLAINYAFGDYKVWGYHAFNLTVHIFAGLTLLGIVRRTMLQPILRERFRGAAGELALAVAVLWTVHPLQTESVTYTAQRAESIMGLFYLLTLYCFIRGAQLPRARLWYGLCLGACALGMASKEVMVSAPLIVLLYDRAFVGNSFREAWRQRWPLYLALAGTWILLGFVLSSGQLPATSRNAEQAGISWWQYLVTEPGVIMHYLRLSVWPHPLCFDYYGWPVARTWKSILPPTVAVVALLGTTIWAWNTGPARSEARPAWGFLGAWFFLILAPSSSVIPLDSPVYEHRMYLPLAAVIVLVVLGIHAATLRQGGLAARHTVAAVAVLAIGLGFITWRRNQDYRSDFAIWNDTVIKRPDNPRAHYNLGNALFRTGEVPEAIGHYEQALRLKPDMADAHYNLGLALERVGRVQEAIGQWEHVVQIRSDDAEAHYHLGNALHEVGETTQAIGQYREALRTDPDYAEAHYNLGVSLWEAGRLEDAIHHYQQAVRLKPDYVEAQNNLGIALQQQGRVAEAIGHYEQALRINPDFAEAHYNLGVALEQAGRVQDAIEQYQQALRLKPDFALARNALARLSKGR